ncbi:helix-turn-helix domain-containing protein [Streptomyces sp. NPDC008313]|uniref:helix-turn-helix domain-containing protein n=1 Tax=Streptomyces sp. NPDC008313 TaxID=3364826 RepID=UPI0036E781C9
MPAKGNREQGSGRSSRLPPEWAEFGEELRYHRRRAGLTQQQLGMRVGYHHSVISKWESGAREVPAAALALLEQALGTGGRLTSAAAADGPGADDAGPVQPGGFFLPPPGGRLPRAMPPVEPGDWPPRLSPGGTPCPLHDGTAGADCAVPPFADLPGLLDEVRRTTDGPVAGAAAAEALHALTALFDRCAQIALQTVSTAVLGTVEYLLHTLTLWARGTASEGRAPYGQLRLASHYAQLAARLRMQRGQGALAMAWVGQGLRWTEATGDLVVRATLMTDLCTLARLDGDAFSSLAYAEALAAVDRRRPWIATLAHAYQARAHAALGDGAQSRHHAERSRWWLDRLGARDLAEAPWLAAEQGRVRIESSVGGALRDLAAATGASATAREAARATERALEGVAPAMAPARLLLTVRLADCRACAGDLEAALQCADPVAEAAAATGRLTIVKELRALDARLTASWGGVREVRDFHTRVRESLPH